MPDDDWKYIESQFESATRDSKRRMHTIANDHSSKLNGAKVALPALVPLYNRFLPILTTWNKGYNDWKDADGIYAGATQLVTGQLDFLTRLQPETGSPLSRWDNAIAVAYPRTSAKYKTIFPRGHDPFHSGTYEEQISAVEQLADRVTTAGGLVTVAAEIATFSANLTGLRKTQQEKEGLSNKARTDMEPLRLAVCEMLYGNLGLLMDIHRANRPAIANYFDLATLRETSPSEDPVVPIVPITPPTP